jgi:hypothetical protein
VVQAATKQENNTKQGTRNKHTACAAAVRPSCSGPRSRGTPLVHSRSRSVFPQHRPSTPARRKDPEIGKIRVRREERGGETETETHRERERESVCDRQATRVVPRTKNGESRIVPRSSSSASEPCSTEADTSIFDISVLRAVRAKEITSGHRDNCTHDGAVKYFLPRPGSLPSDRAGASQRDSAWHVCHR